MRNLSLKNQGRKIQRSDVEFRRSMQFTEFPPLFFVIVTRFFFSREIRLLSQTIRPATRKSRPFSQKIFAAPKFRQTISGTGRFDRTIFRYCRYFRKSRNDFFTRPQPTDSRRSYYDPRPFGTQPGRIQGVRESHRLHREIFFIACPIMAEDYVTEYPVFPIFFKI